MIGEQGHGRITVIFWKAGVDFKAVVITKWWGKPTVAAFKCYLKLLANGALQCLFYYFKKKPFQICWLHNSAMYLLL